MQQEFVFLPRSPATRDASEVACLEHFYDMGAVTRTLSIHAAEDGRELRSFVYFQGESGGSEELHAEVLEQLNTYLRDRAFLDERAGASAPLLDSSYRSEGGQVTVTHEGSSRWGRVGGPRLRARPPARGWCAPPRCVRWSAPDR